MPLTPTKITWNVCADAYGRTVTLTFERRYDGKTGLTIHRAEGGQRDNSESVALLTVDNIRQMAEAIKDLA